eukprot:GHVT01066553.1.p1 GENE.GHVT01066553.1~~GHVT01066553.1.p1  ORF type:complete len:342 (-),score=4.23 GHVT01066553.1:103-1128(-)
MYILIFILFSLIMQEDVCGANPLPGYGQVEQLSLLLVDIAMQKGKLSIDPKTRAAVITAWDELKEHDKAPTKFKAAYNSKWGNTLYGRTKGDPTEAALIQRIKFNKRHTPAHLIDAKQNRLVYCIIKHMWLKAASAGTSSPSKRTVTDLYQVMQQRVNNDDPILSQLGMPLPHINSKCVAAFIKRQTSLASLNSIKPTSTIVRREESVSDIGLPDAPELPPTIPQSCRPQVEYIHTDSRAGQKKVKRRVSKPPSVPLLLTSVAVSGEGTGSGEGILALPTEETVSVCTNTTDSGAYRGEARSTMYKRLKCEKEGAAKKRKYSTPTCVLCNLPSQGHKKYKR